MSIVRNLGTVLIGALGAFALAQRSFAVIVGPYAADASTVHLYHFDEAAGATSSPNAGTAGNSAVAWNGSASAPATPTTLLGGAGFAGFGNSGDLTTTPNALVYDGNNSGAYDPDVNSSTLSPDGITSASMVGGAGSFAIEGLFQFTSGTPATYRELIGTDNTGTDRGFSFRITGNGDLQFRDNDSEDTRVFFAVPTTGDHAYDNSSWFHVAYVYDANDVMGPGTGTGSLYWTKLSDSVTAANLLSQQTTSTTSGNPIIPMSFTDGPLVFGGEGRGSNGGTLQGFIDEVRISNVARGADQFVFAIPEPSGFVLATLAVVLIGIRRRKP